jgi:hypothetical protein
MESQSREELRFVLVLTSISFAFVQYEKKERMERINQSREWNIAFLTKTVLQRRS